MDVHYLVVRKDGHGLSFVKLVAEVESIQSERNCFLEASILKKKSKNSYDQLGVKVI